LEKGDNAKKTARKVLRLDGGSGGSDEGLTAIKSKIKQNCRKKKNEK